MKIYVYLNFRTGKKTPYLVKWVPATRTRKAAIKYKQLQSSDVLNLDKWTRSTLNTDYPTTLDGQLQSALFKSGEIGTVRSIHHVLNK